ncbi:MAG: hypothetical protein ACYDCH_07915 [Gaiellaceae bacterium]
MRMLLAALATAATAVHAAGASPRPQTVYASARPIAAFAQDGMLLAWFSPHARRCNTVSVYSVADGLTLRLPLQGPNDANVTCHWDVVDPVRLAIDRSAALWTLRETAPLQFDYVLGAGIVDRLERRYQEIAHAARGAGLWLGGIAGDGSTLVYAVTAVTYVDEVTCLAKPKARGACALRRSGGGVYRIVGRTPKLVPGTTPSLLVAAASGNVAYVQTAAIARDGRPLANAKLPLVVRDAASGTVVSRAVPGGTPIALALSARVLATLERTPLGLRLAWYDPTTGSATGSVPVPASTSPELSTSDRLIVFHVARSIRVVDVRTRAVKAVAQAASIPIGLSIQGDRIAWAENVKGRGRIRNLIEPLPS